MDEVVDEVAPGHAAEIDVAEVAVAAVGATVAMRAAASEPSELFGLVECVTDASRLSSSSRVRRFCPSSCSSSLSPVPPSRMAAAWAAALERYTPWPVQTSAAPTPHKTPTIMLKDQTVPTAQQVASFADKRRPAEINHGTAQDTLSASSAGTVVS